MQRLMRGGALLALLLAFIVPISAGDPVKQTGDDPKPTTKKDDTKKKVKEKFVWGAKYPASNFPAKITQVDQNSAAKDFTLHVTGKVQEINQGEYQAMVNAQNQATQQYRLAFSTNNPNTRASHMRSYQNSLNQAAQHASRLYRLKNVQADYKFRVSEKCIFRVLEPEAEFDDKGNPVTFTKEDKVRLKYPPTLREKVLVDTKKLSKDELHDLDMLKSYYPDLPGYHAEADVLRTNAMVFVYTPKLKAAPKSTKKKIDNDDPVATLPTDRQEVILVIVDNRKTK